MNGIMYILNQAGEDLAQASGQLGNLHRQLAEVTAEAKGLREQLAQATAENEGLREAASAP